MGARRAIATANAEYEAAFQMALRLAADATGADVGTLQVLDSLGILLNAGVQAVQSTPMVSESGELVGVFSTHYRKPTLPSDRDLEIIDQLAAEAATIIAARRV